ncbi:hypothetical protein I4F81_012142 [Pyropia yezoensis]|uniref:Uncharacterized protein n=1 Tax=Pyropia yezoensis TaxID=2788 RepID=A0ACC3CHL0_PYRYE|nr:hypothetical protein I4F81_012142 [Neopyropia yezoensis]
MVTKVLLAVLAVAAAFATTATATPSPIDATLPTSARPAAKLVKLAFWEMKALATSDSPPCDLHIDDHVFSSRRAGGEPRLRFVVRTDVTLRVGDNSRSFDLRSSCLRADGASPFVCHETWSCGCLLEETPTPLLLAPFMALVGDKGTPG